jgi:hypothetical protein
MSEELPQTLMVTWLAKGYAARLDVPTTAKLLGFAEHDIPVLVASGKIPTLGYPAPNAPKWFAAVVILGLAADPVWLHKATKEVSKYWKEKRARRTDPPAAGVSG